MERASMRCGVTLAAILAATPGLAEQTPDVRAVFDEIVLAYSIADLVVAECADLTFAADAQVLVFPELHAKLAAEGYDITPLLGEGDPPDHDAVLTQLIDWLAQHDQSDLAAVDPCAAARADIADGTVLGQLLVAAE